LLDPRYAYMSAYLKGEEPKVVTPDDIGRMARTSDIQDALAVIRETDIGSYLEELSIKTFEDVDEYLWSYFGQCIRYVESFKFLPGDMLKVSRAYIVKYDVSNIKAALQSVVTGKKSCMIPVGVIHSNGLLNELAAAEDIDSIIEILITCKLGGYVPILREGEVDGGAKSKLVTETGLDGEYYKSMLNMAKGIRDGAVLSKALGLIIDLTNLQIASRAIIDGIGPGASQYIIAGGYLITDKTIRELLSFKLADMPRKLEDTRYLDVAKEILSSYDKVKKITVVEEIIDKHKFMLLKEILSPRVLSPLVMAWYLVLKEVEIRNLRLILKAMVDNIPVEEIRSYLVL